MGVSLIEVYSSRRPLLGVTEQVSVLPAGKEISVSNPSFKVLYFFKGGVVMTLENGVRFEIEAGDIVVVPSACLQAYRSFDSGREHRFHVMKIGFDVRLETAPTDPLARWLRRTFRAPCHVSRSTWADGGYELWSVVMMIRRACEGTGVWNRLLACELARLLVLRVGAAKGAVCSSPPFADASRVAAFCREVFELNAVPPPGPEAAFFEVRTGLSPLSLLRWLRVERARMLLLGSSEPVGRIGGQLGFASAGAFSRVFREVSGLSPIQYRRFHPANSLFSIRYQAMKKQVALHKAEHPALWKWCFHTRQLRLKGGHSALVVMLRGEAALYLPDGVVPFSAQDPRVLLAGRGLQIEGRGARMAVLEVAGFEGEIDFKRLIGRAGWRWLTPATPGGFLALQGALCRQPVNEYQRLMLHALTSAFVYEYLGGASQPPSPVFSEQPSKVLAEIALEYLRKHYSRRLTLGQVAYAVGVSEEHLARVFRAATGQSVMECLFKVRAQAAYRTLRRTQQPIAEVAYGCGFQTVGHFYRIFREVYGRTPASVRCGEK